MPLEAGFHSSLKKMQLYFPLFPVGFGRKIRPYAAEVWCHRVFSLGPQNQGKWHYGIVQVLAMRTFLLSVGK